MGAGCNINGFVLAVSDAGTVLTMTKWLALAGDNRTTTLKPLNMGVAPVYPTGGRAHDDQRNCSVGSHTLARPLFHRFVATVPT